MDARLLDLSVLPNERRRFLAMVGRRSTVQALERRGERRYPILLALAAQSAVDQLDEVVALFDQAVSARESKAKTKTDEALKNAGSSSSASTRASSSGSRNSSAGSRDSHDDGRSPEIRNTMASIPFLAQEVEAILPHHRRSRTARVFQVEVANYSRSNLSSAPGTPPKTGLGGTGPRRNSQ
jgi:hypothetical protein